METGPNTWDELCCFSSYRTYEEWKREVFKMGVVVIVRSYRTYEEWKLVEVNEENMEKMSSYRTYEEWKLA